MAAWVSLISSRPDLPLTARFQSGMTGMLDGGTTRANLTQPIDHPKLKSEIIQKRRNKTGELDTLYKSTLHLHDVGHSDVHGVPAMAYGSLCPLENAICCTTPAQELPLADKPIVQRLFGNPVDLHCPKKEGHEEQQVNQRGSIRGPANISIGGLPSLQQAGWVHAEETMSIQKIRDPQQQEFYLRALAVFGLSPVYRGSDGLAGWLLSFDKSKVPGNPTEIRTLFKRLKNLKHANVVQILEICEERENLLIVYEECTGAGYLPYIAHIGKQLNEPQTARLFQQLAACVLYSHKQHLSILDWSVWNVFTATPNGVNQVKVFGVGLAGILYTDVLPNGCPFNSPVRAAFCYRGPELCRQMDLGFLNPYQRVDPKEREACDVWSIAAIVFCCLVGRPPFIGVDEDEVRRNIVKGIAPDSTVTCDFEFDGEGVKLIQRSLHPHAKVRPRAEEILVHTWVMAKGVHERSADIEIVVDRLLEFIQKPTLMQSIGRLIQQFLVLHKKEYIEDLFCTVDVRGDGSVEAEELAGIAPHRRDEINQIFAVIDDDDCPGIEREQFVHANVFAPNILTDRMLKEVFQTIDSDFSDFVTAAEFFEALHRYNPEIIPEDVSAFLLANDEDWNQELSYEEFRALFPPIKNVEEIMSQQRQRVRRRQEITEDVYAELKDKCVDWIKKLKGHIPRLRKARNQNDDHEEGGGPKVVKSCDKCVNLLRKTLEVAPEIVLPVDAVEYARHMDPATFKTIRPPIDKASGVMALDLFLRVPLKRWYNVLQHIDAKVKEAATIDPEAKGGLDNRQTLLDDAISESITFVGNTVQWTMNYTEEQSTMIEAAGSIEEPIPRPSWSPRALALSRASIEVQQQIKEYQEREFDRRRMEEEIEKAELEVHEEYKKPATVGFIFDRIGGAFAARFGART